MGIELSEQPWGPGTFLGQTKRPNPPAFQEGAIGPDGNKVPWRYVSMYVGR